MTIVCQCPEKECKVFYKFSKCGMITEKARMDLWILLEVKEMEAKTPAGMQYLPRMFRDHGRVRRFTAGSQIFQKDDPAGEIYYLERGKVRAYLLYPDGTERTLCFLERGNLVGEEAVSQPSARIVCADAATDLVMYAMEGKALLTCCAQETGSLPELTTLFMKKIHLLSSWIFYAQFTRNEAKLACFLYSNTQDRQEVRYTQEQIGSVTGMSRVSVSNCLRDLQQRDFVRVAYKRIRVLDRAGLRALFGEQDFY